MKYSKNVILVFGLVLSFLNYNSINSMESDTIWEIEKNLKNDIEKDLKSFRRTFYPKGAFMVKLNKLEYLDEKIIAQGIIFSDEADNAISLILKENLLKKNPSAIINSLDNLIGKLNTFIEKVKESLHNTDELIANAKKNNSIVITKEELELRLKALLIESSVLLLDLKAINHSIDESRYLQ